jgi:exosome complex component RRP42
MFSFASPSSPDIQGVRLLGDGELDLALMKDLVKVRSLLLILFLLPFCYVFLTSQRTNMMNGQEGEKYARQVFIALNTKLRDEDVRQNQKARDRFASHR